jgi:heat shock protein HtpX
MWELIKANRRKSAILFVLMGVCLCLLGYFIGAAVLPYQYVPLAVAFAFIFWLGLAFVSYYSGDKIILFGANAVAVQPNVHAQLFNVVEEMQIAAGLPVMPKIYIVNSPALNAFAVGRDPQNSAIAVTSGLVAKLSRDELQGVVAHEMSHILDRDTLYLTFAACMLGTIIIISDTFLKSFWYVDPAETRYASGGSRKDKRMLLFAILFAIIGPILARILYYAISREREYLADATSARLTRYPEGLASALEKIDASDWYLHSASYITAPMYIASPLRADKTSLFSLGSTHPPIEQRIKILRKLAGVVSYASYRDAFDKVSGNRARLTLGAYWNDKHQYAFRPPDSGSGGEVSNLNMKRNLGDLMMTVSNYIFLNCSCGMKIKVPPDFKQPEIKCPRCGTVVKVA